MPKARKLEDTRDLIAAGLTPPARTRHTWMGGCLFAAALLWVFAIISCVRSVQGEVPPLYAIGLLIAAGTMSVVTTILFAVLALWRAMISDHRSIAENVGRVAALQEQLAQQVKQIDPWTIYCKIAEDLLGIKADPGPLR